MTTPQPETRTLEQVRYDVQLAELQRERSGTAKTRAEVKALTLALNAAWLEIMALRQALGLSVESPTPAAAPRSMAP